MHSHLPGALIALGSSLFLGCFEAPVTERVKLRFGPEGDVEIDLTIEHTRPLFGGGPVSERLDEEERTLLAGWSPWARRFEAVGPLAAEGLAWEKNEGHLRRYRRWAILENPARLVDFFADTPIYADYQEGDEVVELAMYPSSGSRATATDIRRMQTALDDWSPIVAEYLTATAALWSYLEQRPGRARATVGAIFADLVADGSILPEPRPREEPLVSRVVTAMEAVVEIFESPPDEVRTLEEISRRVYDPFPARLVVETPSMSLEVEGFVRGADGRLLVPGLSFWGSFVGLEGHWLAPDPLVAVVAQLRRPDDVPFDLDEFLSRAFWVAPEPPDEADVRLALEERLQPSPVYRVVWEKQSARRE